jgi:hypothetical protein
MKLADNPKLEARIQSRIKVWKNTPQGEDLHESLGLSLEEYALFVIKNEVPDNYQLPE